MKKLPLNEIHKLLGANFRDLAGWSVPNDYGGELSEYTAVRENVGIIDFSPRGKIRLSGKHHLKFLQGMLSNDVLKLEEGEGMYATVLTVKGRMISDMRVYREKESVLLDLEPGLNEKVTQLLTKFRLSYKADIDDITETTGLLSIQGPDSQKLLELLLEEEIPQMAEYSFIQKDVADNNLTIIRVNRTGEEGFDLYLDKSGLEAIWSTLLNKGEGLNIKPVGYSAMNTLRIEAGIPIYGVDMDESNIPIEAGLWDALNFEKGCYVGQEVVARIKWRGHVNWHLMGFKSGGDKAPEIGDEIYSGERKIGRITSSAFSDTLNTPLSIGYIRREFKEARTQVSLKRANGPEVQAEVNELPFYRGSFRIAENADNS